MKLPDSHVHVSEREDAHRWPDGRWDNASWEDCAWDVAVEFARALGRTDIPATHREAEALRAQAGEDTHSGSNALDVRLGLARRYQLFPGPAVNGFDALWRVLVPGVVATVSGSMGVFGWGHHLRRHDPPFRSTHQVFVMRLDGYQRVWWCDPLAPDNTGYRGEWVGRTDLRRFVEGVNNWPTLYGSMVVPEPAPPAPEPDAEGDDTVFNVAPLTTHRDAVLKAGTILYRDSALKVRHSRVAARVALGFAGSTAAAHVVVNAGATNYVRRSDVEQIVPNERSFT